MKFSHREERRGDQLLDLLTDEENGLRLIVSRLGTEMVSLVRRNADGKWIGFLYRDNDITAPANGRANHASVMGYLHRLKGERSLYRGKEIKGGKHSFLRHKVLSGVEANGGETASLTYRISPNEFTKTEYAFKVSLALRYKLSLDFSGVPYLTLWPDGSAFLCVAPCWGLTDHHEQRAFEDKEGMQTIPAGGELGASFTSDPRLEAEP